MRLLIIAYAFPPISAVGAMRPLRWCKHLAAGTDWHPTVISVQSNVIRQDESLAEEIPDVRDRIEICETGTPRTMRRYTGNPNGSIYGYASTVTSHSIHRPQPRTGVSGLYLAGAWTFPAAGFGGTMASGFNTARLVMEDVEGKSSA